jgi:hypothetical protein
MKSERSKEGWLMLDHRFSPGLPEGLVHASYPDLPVNAGKGLFEAPTKSCYHCQAMVVLNPKRQRERAKCPSCRQYICDNCGAAMLHGAACRPFEQWADETLEANVLAEQNGTILLLSSGRRST